jgi:hypothetical protein
MIHTFKHAHKNFKDTRTEKIRNGKVITISQLNAWEIMDYLSHDDCNYLVKHDARIYYIVKPLSSASKADKHKWNVLIDKRYNSKITDYEDDLMERSCGVCNNFLHENFKFVL